MAEEDKDRTQKGLEAMEKYMEDVPMYLADLVAALNEDFASLPDWQQPMVTNIKAELQQRLKHHFDVCAMSRAKFESVPNELWQEGEEGYFQLTEKPRKMLGYLPKRELKHLNNIVLRPCQASVEDMRRELDDIMDTMRADEEDREEIAATLARETYLFDDLAAHHAELKKWRPLHVRKVEIIKELHEREEFLDEITEFENKASGDKERYSKANSLALADENKFRAYAAKKLKELDSKAIKLCRAYEAETKRPFEIDGTLYLEMIKEQKYGMPSNTNLSLAKLKPEKIPAAEQQRFNGLVPSNLVSEMKEGMTKRTSLHETGQDPKIIRKK